MYIWFNTLRLIPKLEKIYFNYYTLTTNPFLKSNLSIDVEDACWALGDFYASSYLLHFCSNQPLCIQCLLNEYHFEYSMQVVIESKLCYDFIKHEDQWTQRQCWTWINIISLCGINKSTWEHKLFQYVFQEIKNIFLAKTKISATFNKKVFQ